VKVVEVDPVGLEQSEGFFERGADRFGAAIDPAFVAIDDDPGFRGEKELVALGRQCLADQRLVVAQAIDPRGIEVVIAQLQRAFEQAAAVLVRWRRAISPAQRHAAQPDRVGRASGNGAPGDSRGG
jgi:hypothetical protein